MKFTELPLNDSVLDALDAMRFEECTPVQAEAIPVILEGRDLIAVAQTGTGKTAAFLLPVISKLSEGKHPEDAINCVIMSPTRELAQQIDQQMEGFSYFLSVSSVPIYGGGDGPQFAQQQRSLSMGADMVIATPGRLLSHMKLGYVDLSKVSHFVLDEADRMLDMGFVEDIQAIAEQLPDTCQTILFSATMPSKIQELAKNIMRDPAEIKLAVSRPADKIEQHAYVCYENQKLPILQHILLQDKPEKVIVFASSKLKVKEITKTMRRLKLNVAEMHSDLDQARREEVMLAFKAGKTQILVGTDIISRGIDIDDITLVVNYDVPHDSEDYVHRIGRTARAKRDGKAITLISEADQIKFKAIEDFLDKVINKADVPEELGEVPAYDPKPVRKGRGRNNRKPGQRNNNGRRPEGHKSGAPRPEGHKDGQKPKGTRPNNRRRGPKPEGNKPADGQQASGEKKPNQRNNNRRRPDARRRSNNKPDGGQEKPAKPASEA